MNWNSDIPEEYRNQIVTGDAYKLGVVLPEDGFDFIFTDPPYPDYYVDLYGEVDITFLKRFNCRQFIFWTAKMDFPMDYTAIHIWDKKTGTGSEYERIFERNGQFNYKVFRYYLINSIVAASYTGDIFTGHPSQKPIRLIREIIEKYTSVDDIIYDPFTGSGTIPVACKELSRNYIAFEIDPDTAELARERVRNTQPPLFVLEPEQQEMDL